MSAKARISCSTRRTQAKERTSIQDPRNVVLSNLVPPFSHDPVTQHRSPLVPARQSPLGLPPDLVLPISSLGDILVERDGRRTLVRSVDGVRTEFGEVVVRLEGVGDAGGILADRELKLGRRERVFADSCK